MRKVQDTPFLHLVPGSINTDQTIIATAKSLDAPLQNVTFSTANLLLYARLLHTAGFNGAQNTLSPLQRISYAAGGLKVLGLAELEQLAWQFHVDFRETATDNVTLAKMIVDSIPWHRIKGTPASMKKAFALFGYDVEIEEDGKDDYWATYQLGLSSVATLEDVKKIAQIAYVTHPARCSLWRIYTDVWDIRPGHYDEGYYDNDAYDLYSGVSVPGLPDGSDVIVSFGRKSSGSTEVVLDDAESGILRTRSMYAITQNRLLYDSAYYDTHIEETTGFMRSRLRSITFGEGIYNRHTWADIWDKRSWRGELLGIGYIRESFTFARVSMPDAQSTYDQSFYDASYYGQPLFTLVDNPASYDAATYDTHDPKRHLLRVDNLIHAIRTSSTKPFSKDVVASTHIIRHMQCTSESFLPALSIWQSKWNKRTWCSYGAQTLLKGE